jgi:LAS superfamily LD-carboxypeptidase LdcB
MRTMLLAVGLAVFAAACVPPAPPPPPQNGRLPDSALTDVSPECRIATEIVGPLSQMLVDARAQGVALAPERTSNSIVAPPRLESCYRSFEMQQWWRDYYCYFGQCGFAAVPGTSIHGWGRAVDFEDQLGEMKFDSPGYAWLTANASRYGFFHPSWADEGQANPEPWHWESH